MPLLVIKNIVRFVAPKDRLSLETVLSPEQRDYVTGEIAQARLSHIEIPAVRSVSDFDAALSAINGLSPKLRGPLLISLAGYCYEFEPQERPIVSALLTAYIRDRHQDEADLTRKIAAILDEESFCRLLLSGVTHKRSLKERAADYLVDNEATITRFETKIIENQAWADILAGENCQSIACKYGITTSNGLKRLEHHVLNALTGNGLEDEFNCHEIAARYGIQTHFGRISLQLKAIGHIPPRVVRQSINCQRLAADYGIDTLTALEKLEERFLTSVILPVIGKEYHVQRLAAKFGITTQTIIELLERYVIELAAGNEVQYGSHCQEVAEKYGITSNKGRILLETQAVDGLPGSMANLGLKCSYLMQNYGLITDAARQLLEQQALRGTVRAEASQGNNCDWLTDKYGICREDSRRKIEEIIHTGLITRKCNQKLNCDQIARKYGISSESGRVALETYKSLGVVGQELRLGNQHCRNIALKHRIITTHGQLVLQNHVLEFCDEACRAPQANALEIVQRYGFSHPSVVAKLERKLVNGNVIQAQIKAGRNCLDIAAQSGIQRPETLVLLQYEIVQATAGAAVRNGMNCVEAARRFGIGSPGALASLETFCLERALKTALEEGNCRAVAARYGIRSSSVFNRLIKDYLEVKNEHAKESKR